MLALKALITKSEVIGKTGAKKLLDPWGKKERGGGGM